MNKKRHEELLLKAYNILQKSVKENGLIEEKLCLNREDLIQEIILLFIQRKYIERYDRSIPFEAYVHTLKNFILRGSAQSCLKQKRIGHVILYSDRYKGKIINYTFDSIITNNEILTEAYKFFEKDEFDILIGELSQAELARQKKVTRQAINNKLRRKIKKFKKYLGEK